VTTPALVLDTNIVSYLFKRTPEAAKYLPHLVGTTPLIAFQTVAELDYGVLKANWGANRIVQLEVYLAQFTLIPYSRSLSHSWAVAKNLARQSGRPIGRRLDRSGGARVRCTGGDA
jgi:tRNA(fMet)-specific endonuclease VapC